MSSRTELPPEAMTFTPGYGWRLDLDVKFDNVRPGDWPDWTVRMHVWTSNAAFTLSNGSGVSFETVGDLPGGPATIPVVSLTKLQTEAFREQSAAINYLIDLAAPGADAEVYFSGTMTKLDAPPADLLS